MDHTNAPHSDQLSDKRIVIMGVCGCGKSTLGAALARQLGFRFVEGDTLHPSENLAKMASGVPLTDEDRRPFLKAIADELNCGVTQGVVLSCSALKRSYRDFLRDKAAPLRFILPVVAADLLRARLSARTGHFMSAAMLDSQLAAFEAPTADERVVELNGTLSVDAQLAALFGDDHMSWAASHMGVSSGKNEVG